MKLSSPLRIIWDWGWPPIAGVERRALPKDRICAIGEELAQARVLMLEIGYPEPSLLADGTVASIGEKIGAQLSLVLTAPALEAFKENTSLRETAEVWVDGTPENGKDTFSSSDIFGGGTAPGLTLYLTAENWREAADRIEAAAAGGARKLSLPNLPLFGRFSGSGRNSVPGWDDLVKFADSTEEVLRSSFTDLRVHNQGLWTLFSERGLHPGGEEAPGHGGCQAGAALGYIDPGGTLYPCASLPVPLGSVEKGTISAVWGGTNFSD